jgi:GNAT superfamily N-acetyltransferase
VTAALALVHPSPAPEPTGVWWARITRRGTAPVEHSLVAVCSDRFPAGTPVDLSALNARGRRPAGWLVDLRYRAADGAVVRIDVADTVADPGLPVWFTETHHSGAAIPAVTLAAGTGGSIAPGSLVTPQHAAAGRPLGSLRWQLRSGLVDSLTVHPDAEGRRIGRLLVVAAGALATLRGWPALTGDLTEHAAAAERPTGVERMLSDRVTRLI